jgi:protein-tyrosine phosphatase
MPGQVLTVCSANVCRSPMMQYILDDALQGRWSVTSAGTRARDGWGMDALAQEVLAARGLHGGAGFRARRLAPAMIDGADLVLTAEAAHRSAVVEVRPNAVNRTFTLFQFARLLESAAPSGSDDIAAVIAAARSARPHARRDDDDLHDPVGRPRADYEATAERIARAARTIAIAAGAWSASSGRTIPPERPFAPTR